MRTYQQRTKKKTTLADHIAALEDEARLESELLLKAEAERKQRLSFEAITGAARAMAVPPREAPSKPGANGKHGPTSASVAPQHRPPPPPPTDPSNASRVQGKMSRALKGEHLQPVVDLAYSQTKSVQLQAIGLLATLSINTDNQDLLIASGSLKPLLASCSADSDPSVRRHALAGLAHMTSREDIRARVCSVEGGATAIIDALRSPDHLTRLAAAECVANIASSARLRGHLIEHRVLPAITSLLVAKAPSLKRWSMLALQRLAAPATAAADVTTSDPDGDGYAAEVMDEGVVLPLLALLKGGPTVEEELRTHAVHTIHELAAASDAVKVKLCVQHTDLLRTLVGLLLLEDHPGGATQREAARVVQLLAQVSAALPLLLRAGVLGALGVLARADAILKKQVAANLLLRLASDSDCRRPLLDFGAARTLCSLARPTMPRKVCRPAVSALTGLCQLDYCVGPLLEAGVGATLAVLASSSDPELRLDACRALADMLECHTADPLRVADMVMHQGALGVFFGAAYSRDRQTQLSASRGVLAIAQRSRTHARVPRARAREAARGARPRARRGARQRDHGHP